MEKLEQVDINCVCAIECTEFEVCVDQIEKEPEKSVQIKQYKKPAKFCFSKLFKKSRLNAKYIKETMSIETLKYRKNYRIYGIF